MQWETKKPPTLGDRRTITKFAWLPHRNNGWTVWLERYRIVEQYTNIHRYDNDGHGVTTYEWRVVGESWR